MYKTINFHMQQLLHLLYAKNILGKPGQVVTFIRFQSKSNYMFSSISFACIHSFILSFIYFILIILIIYRLHFPTVTTYPGSLNNNRNIYYSKSFEIQSCMVSSMPL